MSAQLSMRQQQQKSDVCKREKNLAEREFAVVRLELEAMRKTLQIERAAEDDRLRQSIHSVAASDECERAKITTAIAAAVTTLQRLIKRTSITAIADLRYFRWQAIMKLGRNRSG